MTCVVARSAPATRFVALGFSWATGHTPGMFVMPSSCSRRYFLGQMGGGFGAVALSALGQLEARAAGAKAAVEPDPLNPFKSREPHFAPRARSVIFTSKWVERRRARAPEVAKTSGGT